MFHAETAGARHARGVRGWCPFVRGPGQGAQEWSGGAEPSSSCSFVGSARELAEAVSVLAWCAACGACVRVRVQRCTEMARRRPGVVNGEAVARLGFSVAVAAVAAGGASGAAAMAVGGQRCSCVPGLWPHRRERLSSSGLAGSLRQGWEKVKLWPGRGLCGAASVSESAVVEATVDTVGSKAGAAARRSGAVQLHRSCGSAGRPRAMRAGAATTGPKGGSLSPCMGRTS